MFLVLEQLLWCLQTQMTKFHIILFIILFQIDKKFVIFFIPGKISLQFKMIVLKFIKLKS